MSSITLPQTTSLAIVGNTLLADSAVVTKWLIKNGFSKYHGEYEIVENGFDSNGKKKYIRKNKETDFTLIMRVHELHYLIWSENLSYFFIAVKNDKRKKEAAGVYKKWNAVIIPKLISDVKTAKKFLDGVL